MKKPLLYLATATALAFAAFTPNRAGAQPPVITPATQADSTLPLPVSGTTVRNLNTDMFDAFRAIVWDEGSTGDAYLSVLVRSGGTYVTTVNRLLILGGGVSPDVAFATTSTGGMGIIYIMVTVQRSNNVYLIRYTYNTTLGTITAVSTPKQLNAVGTTGRSAHIDSRWTTSLITPNADYSAVWQQNANVYYETGSATAFTTVTGSLLAAGSNPDVSAFIEMAATPPLHTAITFTRLNAGSTELWGYDINHTTSTTSMCKLETATAIGAPRIESTPYNPANMQSPYVVTASVPNGTVSQVRLYDPYSSCTALLGGFGISNTLSGGYDFVNPAIAQLDMGLYSSLFYPKYGSDVLFSRVAGGGNAFAWGNQFWAVNNSALSMATPKEPAVAITGNSYRAINSGGIAFVVWWDGSVIKYKEGSTGTGFKPTALEDVSASNKVSVYPNPVTDILHIDNADGKSYYVADVTGRTLLQGQVTTGKLDVGLLAQGTYFLVISTQDGRQTHKFIKE